MAPSAERADHIRKDLTNEGVELVNIRPTDTKSPRYCHIKYAFGWPISRNTNLAASFLALGTKIRCQNNKK